MSGTITLINEVDDTVSFATEASDLRHASQEVKPLLEEIEGHHAWSVTEFLADIDAPPAPAQDGPDES